VPDATGLELIAQELRAADGAPEGATSHSPILETRFFRGRGTLVVEPERVRAVLAHLRERGYSFMSSLHGVDHYPHEPRLGVVYELLDMARVDRITVKVLLGSDAPVLESVKAGLRRVSSRTILKSSMPCRTRFMRAIDEVVRFFSWP